MPALLSRRCLAALERVFSKASGIKTRQRDVRFETEWLTLRSCILRGVATEWGVQQSSRLVTVPAKVFAACI